MVAVYAIILCWCSHF